MITVVDIGKTNTKCVVLDERGEVIWEERSTQSWVQNVAPSTIDVDALMSWIIDSTSRASDTTGSKRLIVTTHGLTVGYGDEFGGTPLPILDYEYEIPADYAFEFSSSAPSFAETYSPVLPLGFNFGAQVDYLARSMPREFANVKFLMGFPQFIAWKLTGRAVSERTYLGHLSQCWAPVKNDFSSLVYQKGWTSLFPPLLEAGQPLGLATNSGSRVLEDCQVFNGIHDSSASLHFYRHLGHSDFTLISTGTWVIMFDMSYPLTALKPSRDMLASVTTRGETVATLRFMGGREYELLSDRSRLQVSEAEILNVLEKKIFAMPGLSEGGQFPNCTGEIQGPTPQDQREKTALASLYLACMTRNGLETIGARVKIVVDGGLCRNRAFLSVLGGLMPHTTILANPHSEGTALGAACTVNDDGWSIAPNDPCEDIVPWKIQGLEKYFLEWQARAEALNAAG